MCRACGGRGGRWRRWCYMGMSRLDFYLCKACGGSGEREVKSDGD